MIQKFFHYQNSLLGVNNLFSLLQTVFNSVVSVVGKVLFMPLQEVCYTSNTRHIKPSGIKQILLPPKTIIQLDCPSNELF